MDLNDYLTSNDESCVTIGFTILNNQGKTKKECMEILRHNNFKKAFKGREKPYTASTTKFYMITDNNFHAHSYVPR